MKPKMILILFLFLAVLASAHVLVYFGIALSFGISGTAALLAIKLILAGMTMGFIGIMFIARKINNGLTRTAYWLLSTWLGLFLYLVLASMGALASQVPLVGKIAFGLAVLVTAYGLINAGTIRVTRYSVTLPSLPPEWKDKTIAFISDIHLGQKYGAGFSQRIVSRLNDLKPELLLIGGDLYDGIAVDEVATLAPFAHLSLPYGAFFITGNHDQYGNEGAYLKAIKDVGIRHLDNETVTIGGLQFAGVDFHDTAHRDHYEEIMKTVGIDQTKPSIFMKHVPTNLDIAERAGVSLHLSGHTHRAQMFPLNFITNAVYKGYDYGMKAFGTMTAITSSGIGNWGPGVRVGSKSEIVLITLN